MNNRILILTAAFVAIFSLQMSGTALAENCLADKDFRVYLNLGGSTIDIDPLNTRLASKGYSEFSDGFGTAGIGAYIKGTGRFLIGLEAAGLAGERTSFTLGSDHYSSRLYGGYGFLNAGYIVFSSKRFEVFPLVGVGFGKVNMKFGKTSFDEILDNPQNETYITTYGMLLNASLQTDFKIWASKGDSGMKSITLGIRGGYIGTPFEAGWYQNEFELSGAPDGGITGSYFAIVLGGSGFLTADHLKNKFIK